MVWGVDIGGQRGGVVGGVKCTLRLGVSGWLPGPVSGASVRYSWLIMLYVEIYSRLDINYGKYKNNFDIL